MSLPFGERLAQACHSAGAPVAVGLDPHLGRLPLDLQARFEGKTGRAHREAAAESVVAFCAAPLARKRISPLLTSLISAKPGEYMLFGADAENRISP